jgi:aminopeptidase N
LKSQIDVWVKENERTIAFVQSYRMRNSFPNPVYVNDILLTSNNVNLLHEKKFLSSRFNKNVLGELSIVIRIKTHRDGRNGY